MTYDINILRDIITDNDLVSNQKEALTQCITELDQREKGCAACKELSKIYDARQELVTAKFTNHNTGKANLILVQDNLNPQMIHIEVNYCPWCGRKI